MTEHELYIKKINRNKRKIIAYQISIFIIFICLWEFLSSNGIINSFIFSSPRKIINTLIELCTNNNLFDHILITTYETFVSFILTTIIGLIVATILWWNDNLAKILDIYLVIFNSLPKVSLGPLIIIWFGANTTSIIITALMISVTVTILNIYEGFINTPKEYINLLTSYKVSKEKLFISCILKANSKTIYQTMKVNIGLCLIGVIMGELLVSKKGIGYLIMYGSQVFNLNLVITGVILLGILSIIIYKLISPKEKS